MSGGDPLSLFGNNALGKTDCRAVGWCLDCVCESECVRRSPSLSGGGGGVAMSDGRLKGIGGRRRGEEGGKQVVTAELLIGGL